MFKVIVVVKINNFTTIQETKFFFLFLSLILLILILLLLFFEIDYVCWLTNLKLDETVTWNISFQWSREFMRTLWLLWNFELYGKAFYTIFIVCIIITLASSIRRSIRASMYVCLWIYNMYALKYIKYMCSKVSISLKENLLIYNEYMITEQ